MLQVEVAAPSSTPKSLGTSRFRLNGCLYPFPHPGADSQNLKNSRSENSNSGPRARAPAAHLASSPEMSVQREPPPPTPLRHPERPLRETALRFRTPWAEGPQKRVLSPTSGILEKRSPLTRRGIQATVRERSRREMIPPGLWGLAALWLSG